MKAHVKARDLAYCVCNAKCGVGGDVSSIEVRIVRTLEGTNETLYAPALATCIAIIIWYENEVWYFCYVLVVLRGTANAIPCCDVDRFNN